MSEQTFGEAFRKARMQGRKTLRDISEATGYAISYLSSIEHGRIPESELSPIMRERIEKFLGTILPKPNPKTNRDTDVRLMQFCGWILDDLGPDIMRDPQGKSQLTPRVSSDGTACFKYLVRKMRDTGLYLSLYNSVPQPLGWIAIFTRIHEGEPTGSYRNATYTESPMEAICLAALAYLDATQKKPDDAPS